MRPLLILLATALTSAGETPAPPPPEKPPVEQISPTRYRIGQIIIDKKTREIRLPAIVNLREGLLEYLIVHTNGKIHESLLSTDTSPTHLNIALKLLRYKPSKELYRIPTQPGTLSENFHQEPKETTAASRLSIHVEHQKDGKTHSIPIHQWIRHETTAKSMEPTPWIYGGGEFYQNTFLPTQTGDIAAIFITNTSLINYPGKDNLNDEVWTPLTERIPELGTKVTLIFAPYQEP